MDNITKNGSKSTTIRAWFESRKMLRLIAALTDSSMAAVIDQLARKEYERLQKEQAELHKIMDGIS